MNIRLGSKNTRWQRSTGVLQGDHAKIPGGISQSIFICAVKTHTEWFGVEDNISARKLAKTEQNTDVMSVYILLHELSFWYQD